MLKQNLIKVRELLSDPACWTQHEMARDRNGVPTDSNSDEAVCFCMLGAIQNQVHHRDARAELRFYLEKFIPDTTLIHQFNDFHTHEEVLKVLDEAIARADHQ